MRAESQVETTETPGLLSRLLRDDRGQDLIEYALLAFTIGLVGIVTWDSIVTGIGDGYDGWDPQDPAAGP